jgi:hypothetical protein
VKGHLQQQLADNADAITANRLAPDPSRPVRRADLRRGTDPAPGDGEAVKALPTAITETEPEIPWTQIARLRDHLAHRYFDTNPAIVQAIGYHDLPELDAAVAVAVALQPPMAARTKRC